MHRVLGRAGVPRKKRPQYDRSCEAQHCDQPPPSEDYETAKVYYEYSLQVYENVKTGWLTWIFVGDVNKKRANYTKGRLVELTLGRKPDKRTYMDGDGKERQWTDNEIAVAKGEQVTWSWVSPWSWWHYYTYKPIKSTDTSHTL